MISITLYSTNWLCSRARVKDRLVGVLHPDFCRTYLLSLLEKLTLSLSRWLIGYSRYLKVEFQLLRIRRQHWKFSKIFWSLSGQEKLKKTLSEKDCRRRTRRMMRKTIRIRISRRIKTKKKTNNKNLIWLNYWTLLEPWCLRIQSRNRKKNKLTNLSLLKRNKS